MEDIIERTKKLLQKQGKSNKEIGQAVYWMQNTCVACKYGKECMSRGYITTPYHPKCERHELVEDFAKNAK